MTRAQDMGEDFFARIPYGFCHCGCGEKTARYVRSRASRGAVKGEPKPYEAEFRIIGQIVGHGDQPKRFVIADWAGPLPRGAFAAALTDAGGLQWVDAANAALQAWEEFSEARDQLCAARALLRLSDEMDSLASWLPGYNARTGRVDDVVSGEVYCADCGQLDGHEGPCNPTDARAAFLTGEGTLTAAEVQAWALELGGQIGLAVVRDGE